MIKLYNQDCMEAMAEMKDNQFDLAIVDPPYGIKYSSTKQSKSQRGGRKNKTDIIRFNHKRKRWDNNKPTKKYFTQLLRVSKNQIIWGSNYFTKYLKETNSWIIWDKCQVLETRSDGEMAWTSYKKALKIVPLIQDGFKRGLNIGKDSPIIYNKPFGGKMNIHPTQKPVALYKWLLQNYAKENDKILDTHLGSGSIAIACNDMGFDLTGYELDTEYYNGACERLEKHQSQGDLFSGVNLTEESEQENLVL